MLTLGLTLTRIQIGYSEFGIISDYLNVKLRGYVYPKPITAYRITEAPRVNNITTMSEGKAWTIFCT